MEAGSFSPSSRTAPHTAAPETPGQRPAVSRCVTPNKRPPARKCECHPGPVSEQLKSSVNFAEIEITSPASRVTGMVSGPRPGTHERCSLSVRPSQKFSPESSVLCSGEDTGLVLPVRHKRCHPALGWGALASSLPGSWGLALPQLGETNPHPTQVSKQQAVCAERGRGGPCSPGFPAPEGAGVDLCRTSQDSGLAHASHCTLDLGLHRGGSALTPTLCRKHPAFRDFLQ